VKEPKGSFFFIQKKKKIIKNFKKPIDKKIKVWYNNSTEKEDKKQT
jgi:hypothetical protein